MATCVLEKNKVGNYGDEAQAIQTLVEEHFRQKEACAQHMQWESVQQRVSWMTSGRPV